MAGPSTDFEDPDFGGQPGGGPAPTLGELDSRLTGAQNELTRLKQSSEELERQIQAIEERRRRRTEFARSLEEMRQNLARATGLLGKAELDARREAEQLAKTLESLRAAASGLEPLDESRWTAENWESELTHGLTVVENARLDYHAARMKWPVLDGVKPGAGAGQPGPAAFPDLPLGRLMRLGLALTWPVAVAAVLALVLLGVLAFRR